MTDPDYSQVKDTNVPHEGEVAEAIDAQMERTSTQAAIANATNVGGTYNQSEINTQIVAKLNQVLGVLRDAELIPPT